MIEFTCDDCGTRAEIAPDALDAEWRCPGCGAVVVEVVADDEEPGMVGR